MDRAQERLATFEQTPPDELRTTDAELPVGIVMNDRNAERAIDGVIKKYVL